MIGLKQIVTVFSSADSHWVGNGFHVRSFPLMDQPAEKIDPFLLLDYAGPTYFPANTGNGPHGVGEHPHRGFETVTIMYQGAVQHRDSAGNHGIIGPGDVQWMTAASGVVHEEKHEHGFAKHGGTLEAIQLWVNLPRVFKKAAPQYQTLLKDQIPVLTLPNDGGYIRVIAGEFQGKKGTAKTHTNINLLDVFLTADQTLTLKLPEGLSTGLFFRHGAALINEVESVADVKFVLFEAHNHTIVIKAERDTAFLVLNAEPIGEPVVSYGPFVMNSSEEIRQAMEDYRNGVMGHVCPDIDL